MYHRFSMARPDGPVGTSWQASCCLTPLKGDCLRLCAKMCFTLNIFLYMMYVCGVLIPPHYKGGRVVPPNVPSANRFLAAALSSNHHQPKTCHLKSEVDRKNSFSSNSNGVLWEVLEWWGVSNTTNFCSVSDQGGNIAVGGSGDYGSVVTFLDALDKHAADTGCPWMHPSAIIILSSSLDAKWNEVGLILSLSQRLSASGFLCWGNVAGAALACLPADGHIRLNYSVDISSDSVYSSVRSQSQGEISGVTPPPLNPFFCRVPSHSGAAISAINEFIQLGSTPSFPGGLWGALLMDLEGFSLLGESREACVDSEGVGRILEALATLACAANEVPPPSNEIASGLAALSGTLWLATHAVKYRLGWAGWKAFEKSIEKIHSCTSELFRKGSVPSESMHDAYMYHSTPSTIFYMYSAQWPHLLSP